jgi:excisionase family DNA binding protein
MAQLLRELVSMALKKCSSAPAVIPELLLLDIHGAARALSATPWAIRSLLWDGKIAFIKIGRRFLVDPADLRAYIAREKSGGEA